MKMKERIALYDRQAPILEKVAESYPERSAEHQAVRQAAIALWYVLSGQHGDFLDYLRKWECGELSSEQEAHLRSMGLDPDSAGDGERGEG
jgi:hypothetical protein